MLIVTTLTMKRFDTESITKMFDNPFLKGLDLSFDKLPEPLNYSQPEETFIFYKFLGKSPVGRSLKHIYLPSIEQYKRDCEYTLIWSRVVIHGHKEDELCYAPNYCHLQGFKPDSTNHPAFIKQFYFKWDYLYER